MRPYRNVVQGGIMHTSRVLQLLPFGMVLVLAGFTRFWVAPFSAGPDVAQFWAFARVFESHNLDFYRYADASLGIFPFKLWGFVYPPVWILILGLALLAAPSSLATQVMVDPSWRLAMKTPIILADLAIGLLIYWAVHGSRRRKLTFASLWLFHPAVWYQSAVFGQFDAIAAAFLLASVLMFERKKNWLAFLLAGIAVMTKQHTFIPLAVILALNMRQLDKSKFLKNLLFFFAPVAALSIPFLVNGNFQSYFQALFLPVQAPNYQYPLCYAFSGSGALLTYLHDVFSWNTLGLLYAGIPLLVVAIVVVIILSYVKSVNYLQGALVGFLLFVAIFYRVNYQYLIIYIPLAILIASRTPWTSEKAVTIALALLPACWIWLFDISYWFNYFEPVSSSMTHLLARVGLTNGMPDYAYVILAVIIAGFCITYIVFTFLRWQRTSE